MHEVFPKKTEREAVAAAILGAQKFDFGPLLLERVGDNAEGGLYQIPTLSKDEAEFFQAGLVPLPFKSVWYEFIIGGTRSGMLLEEDGDVWRTQRLEYEAATREVMFDGIQVSVHNARPYMTREWVSVSGNRALMQLFGPTEFTAMNYGANAPLAYYLTLMLNSRTTSREPGPVAPPRLARAQQRRGRTPLPEHTVVRIVPDSYLKESAAEGARTHASPRLHWRRSHLRHYDHRVPSAKYAEGITHQGKTGWWCTVIPRMLVGRADLGEVSHEYFVRAAEPGDSHHRPPKSVARNELVK